MKLRCPVCHAESSIEALSENIAAKEFMSLIDGMPREMSRPLLAYLGLWRSPSRALSWERALRIAHEVIEIDAGPETLGAALSHTVEALREKRSIGRDRRALTSHGYLQRVLESGQVKASTAERSEAAESGAMSKTAQALMSLEGLKRDRKQR